MGNSGLNRQFIDAELQEVWSFCMQHNDTAFQAAASVKWDLLQRIATTFAENMKDAACIRMLPVYSAMWGRKDLEHLMVFLEVFLSSPNRLQWYEDPRVRAEVDAQVKTKLREKGAGEEYIRALAQWGTQAERELMSHGVGRNMLVRVIFAVLTSTWTAFETLTGDIWRLFVNSFPHVVTQARMQQAFLDGSEGISSRSLSVGVISRQHFDLRNCMGDLLAQKINFSDLGQLRKAYADLFEDQEVKEVFESKHLRLLEETRHLILHRSARVDEKFNRVTGCSFPMGEILPIGKLPLQRMVDAAYDCGCFVIRFVEQRYQQLSIA